MQLEVTCEECGKSFTAKSRRARFCGATCRVRANRRPTKRGKASTEGKVVAIATKAGAGTAKTRQPRSARYETLEEQVRQSLTDIKALDTISGMAAVRVAQQIDRGGDSGSAVATLSKELSRLVGEAKAEAAPRNRDEVDDIAALVNAKILRLVQ